MKRFIIMLVIAVMACLTCSVAAFAGGQAKKNVIVMDFGNASKIGGLAAQVTTKIESRVSMMGNIQVYPKQKAKALLGNRYNSHVGYAKAALGAQEIAQLKKAKVAYIITGSIVSATAEKSGIAIGGIGGSSKKSVVEIRVCVIDVDNGKVMIDVTGKGSASEGGGYIGDIGFAKKNDGYDGYRLAATKAVDDILNKLQESDHFALTGAIADVEGGKVIINLGVNDGVQKGDEFVIFVEGDPIINPTTGAIIGVKHIEKGTLKIDDAQGQFAIGKAKKGKNGEIRVGDTVKRTKIKRS